MNLIRYIFEVIERSFNQLRSTSDGASLTRSRSRIFAATCALSSVIAAAPTAYSTPSTAPTLEQDSCRVVRFSDIGWTDVTATTGFASHVLRRLGYDPKVTVLSLPVTYASLRNRDIDVFLGNWMPSQKADRQPYLDDGSIEVVRANMTEAKYTLAVPTYLYEQGLRDFADIAKFAEPLKRKIYGIEPGNDGNRMMLELIEAELAARNYKWAKLTGETVDRQAEVEKFQGGKVPIFLLSLKAGGVGLNLTAADTVIHYDPWWNPAAENQATDRAHRIGQDKPIFVYKLIAANSVEQKIMDMQKKKGDLAAMMLDGADSGWKALTSDDLVSLFS